MTVNVSINGFKAASIASGLKKNNGKDIALIYAEGEAVAAGVFTRNKVKAAPVLLSEENIKKGKSRAIIVNSGNANACTGKQGMENALRTIQMVAERLNIQPNDVLVASTGVIGAQLDMDKVEGAIPALVEKLDSRGIKGVAEAIMTTDSFPKISTFTGGVKNVSYNIIGIAKGAGMIMPDMATMLCFILTDINIRHEDLKEALFRSVDNTFNRITVDGDTSTNDTVLVLANGASGNDEPDNDSLAEFMGGLEKVMSELATMIVRDGEGATKLIYVHVKGASSPENALAAARTVANSSLVKTAFYGQDPNWGRIMAALGRSGIKMKESTVDIWIDDVKIVAGGLGLGSDKEKTAALRMKNSEFSLTIDLNQGDYDDRITTCDLTHDYVSINADYRT